MQAVIVYYLPLFYRSLWIGGNWDLFDILKQLQSGRVSIFSSLSFTTLPRIPWYFFLPSSHAWSSIYPYCIPVVFSFTRIIVCDCFLLTWISSIDTPKLLDSPKILLLKNKIDNSINHHKFILTRQVDDFFVYW